MGSPEEADVPPDQPINRIYINDLCCRRMRARPEKVLTLWGTRRTYPELPLRFGEFIWAAIWTCLPCSIIFSREPDFFLFDK